MFTVWLIPWWPLPLWNSTIMRDATFLSTAMVHSTVYFSLTSFHSIPFSSSTKPSTCFDLMLLAFFLQKMSCHCSSLNVSKFSFDLVRFFSWTEHSDCYKDKLSITTVIFIRSENNLALLQLFVLLVISEHMPWIQSMLRDTCGYRGLTIGWNCLS